MGYRANAPNTIGKKYFEEGGVTTCSKQRKTENIHRRNPEGRLYVETNWHKCGAPAPPGEYCIGMNPPMLSTYK